MEKKQKSESVSSQLLLIKTNLENLRDNNLNDNESIDESIIALDSIIDFFKGIRKVLNAFTLIIISLLILVGISVYYFEKAKNIETEIDAKTDTIANQILEVKKVVGPDSTFKTNYEYFTRNNKIVSYKTFSKENDSLRKVVEILNIQNQKKDNNIEQLNNDNLLLTDKIRLAEKYYGIRFWETTRYNKNKKEDFINIESKKIDSALILLEIYRKKMSYNKEKGVWVIK